MYYNISKAQENPPGAELRIHTQSTGHPYVLETMKIGYFLLILFKVG